ncbi:tumor necrosis factor receptor superfamily member 16-like isoform X2 [Acropora muricata]|uniref:tumor necrosis factor receptor superfamily member 16-like isoform X2 n=1 Tax=Acropora muricata TaxID=159855 RepID=UPI0034E3C38B
MWINTWIVFQENEICISQTFNETVRDLEESMEIRFIKTTSVTCTIHIWMEHRCIMQAAQISYLVLWIASPALAAKLNCPEAHFWNGTSCNPCSGCPVGQGVKTNCSQSRDTICQDCWLGFDYSNSTGMEACKGCDQDSNCLPGNSKVIQKCTLTSATVCDGCKEGFYLNLFAGEEGGGCMECSQSCSGNEIETQSCNTKHDRVCSKRPSTTEKTSTKRPSTTEKTSTNRPSTTEKTSTKRPTTLRNSSATREVSTLSPSPVNVSGKGDGKGSEPEKIKETDQPLHKKSWLWAVIAAGGVIIALPVVVGTAVKYRQPRPPVDNNEGIRLIRRRQPQPRGLDQTIRSIDVEGRSFIAERLNDKDSQDYLFFLRVAEKLGISKECRGFTCLRNPTEAFLQLYSEREGSTLRALVGALRECGLTLIASEIETEFASVQETEELKAADMDESIV